MLASQCVICFPNKLKEDLMADMVDQIWLCSSKMQQQDICCKDLLIVWKIKRLQCKQDWKLTFLNIYKLERDKLAIIYGNVILQDKN